MESTFAGGEVQEVSAVGKKLRIARSCLCDSDGLTAGRRNTKDLTNSSRSKKDHAISVPRASAASYSVCQGLYRAAIDVEPFELVLRKKTEGTAIGRPERIRCAFGSRQWPSRN